MFLKLRNDHQSSRVEVLDLQQLFDPFSDQVQARLHGGEELQDPGSFLKADLLFPSGEELPRCWLQA
jgi:hypothetical protein